jgi:hypothetical protein
MRAVVQTIAILLVSFLLELFFPWWSIAVAGCLVGYGMNARWSFATGFAAITVLWLSRILVFEHSAATPLAEKVAHIFTLPNHITLILVTVLVGGIVGGMATLTGSLLRGIK